MRNALRNMALLGFAPIYQNRNGQLVADTDQLERPGNDPVFGDDDFGEDEVGDDEYGDDEVGDDELGEDEVGARGRRRGRRAARKSARQARKSDWAATIVSGSQTLGAAGSTSVAIRLQHDFKAKDITFQGSLANTLITSIRFGDRMVFDAPNGVNIAVFASDSFVRGLLKNQDLRAGLDITINATLPGAGTVSASVIGEKPVMSRC